MTIWWHVFLAWSLTALPRLRKQILWRHGPRNIVWCLGWIFPKLVSEIYFIISLWNPLFGFFCVIKKIFVFYVGSFSLLTHALTCLSRQHWNNNWNIVILWSSNFYCSEAFSLTTLNSVDGYRARGVFTKVLHQEAQPRDPTPYPFIYQFWPKRCLFRIPSIDKWYPFHIPGFELCILNCT